MPSLAHPLRSVLGRPLCMFIFTLLPVEFLQSHFARLFVCLLFVLLLFSVHEFDLKLQC